MSACGARRDVSSPGCDSTCRQSSSAELGSRPPVIVCVIVFVLVPILVLALALESGERRCEAMKVRGEAVDEERERRPTVLLPGLLPSALSGRTTASNSVRSTSFKFGREDDENGRPVRPPPYKEEEEAEDGLEREDCKPVIPNRDTSSSSSSSYTFVGIANDSFELG